MKDLILAQDGIFPITKGLNGESLTPKTGFAISGTIQGEGKLAGVPSLFIRLYGCNLNCAWKSSDSKVVRCDTPHAIDPHMTTEKWAVSSLLEVVKQNMGNMRHLVITGGEPLLQKSALVDFLREAKQWKSDLHVTIETNGTMFSASLCKYVDLFSVSPKLTSSNALGKKVSMDLVVENVGRYTLARLRNKIDLQLKFVISSLDDLNELETLFMDPLSHASDDDVLLMPMGIGDEAYKTLQNKVCEWAIERGWRFAPRLHLLLFGHTENT